MKAKLENAAKQKVAGATTADAKGTITLWRDVIEDAKASHALKAAAVLRVRELEAPPILENATNREAALNALAAVAVANQ